MTIDPHDVRQLIRLATTRTGNAIYDDDLAQEADILADRVEGARRIEQHEPVAKDNAEFLENGRRRFYNIRIASHTIQNPLSETDELRGR